MDLWSWDFHLFYDQKCVGSIGCVDPDSINYNTLLQYINDKSFQNKLCAKDMYGLRVQFPDYMDGDALRTVKTDFDVLEMFISYKAFHHIKLFISHDFPISLSNTPLLTPVPPPRPSQLNPWYHPVLWPWTPKLPKPHQQNTSTPPLSCNHVGIDSETEDDDVVAEPDNEETRSRTEAEENEYLLEADDIYCLREEDADLEAKREGCGLQATSTGVLSQRNDDELISATHTGGEPLSYIEANSTCIHTKLLETFRRSPTMKLTDMQNKLSKGAYGSEVECQRQLYRAKVKAIEELEGRHAKSFELLPAYMDELMRTNPGSRIQIQYDEAERRLYGKWKFKRVFMAIASQKEGFVNGCRPFIGLGGCHLRGPYRGTLLAAVGLDGNNGVYPIAVAVVESESTLTWEFFLKHLNHILDADNVTTEWTFMYDGQKDLSKVLQKHFPNAEQRRCAWHLFNNFRARYPGVMLAKYFWKASRACTKADFNNAMANIEKINVLAHAYLLKLPVKHWSRHAFKRGLKSDHVTNNHTKSFHSWLGDLREKTIIDLLDGIRKKLIERKEARKQKSLEWEGKLCRVIRNKLNKSEEEGRKCSTLADGRGDFQIVDGLGVKFIVDIPPRTCTCGHWMISGIPCKHSCAAISWSGLDVEDFVDKCYYRETYEIANGLYKIQPLDDPSHQPPETSCTPPQIPVPIREHGRPPNARKRKLDFEMPATGSQAQSRKASAHLGPSSQNSQASSTSSQGL